MKLNQWFFEKIKKYLIYLLTRVIKKKRQRTQINKIGSEKKDTSDRHHRNTKIIRDNSRNYMPINGASLKVDKLLERHNLRLN